MIQPKVTIVLTVSRKLVLERLFASLELMTCDRRRTSLLVVVDGNMELFLKCRNLVNESKFEQRLAIQYKTDKKLLKYNKLARRRRIADIRNQSKEYMWDSEYVMGLEDDTIAPQGALKRLLRAYTTKPYAGFIEGLELGRWGLPYIGAWQVDDIYEPKDVRSITMPGVEERTELIEIDAGGFYCYLTKHEEYIRHEYKPFEDGSQFGPDVDYGLSLRRKGLMNYIDVNIVCDHYDEKSRLINPTTTPVTPVRLMRDKAGWRFY